MKNILITIWGVLLSAFSLWLVIDWNVIGEIGLEHQVTFVVMMVSYGLLFMLPSLLAKSDGGKCAALVVSTVAVLMLTKMTCNECPQSFILAPLVLYAISYIPCLNEARN